jgi:uncharacterized protein YndB with AHSA1/START domain
MTNSLTLSIPDGQPYIDFTREFDAPAAAVFEAHRDPALVARWLGPRREPSTASTASSTLCGRTSSRSRRSSSRATPTW